MAKLVQTHLAQCSVPSSDPKKVRVRAGQAHWIVFFFQPLSIFSSGDFLALKRLLCFCNPGAFYFKHLSTFPSSLLKLFAFMKLFGKSSTESLIAV